MAWLIRGEEVLASLDVADSFATRLKGLLGRDGIEGAYLIKPASSVHTIGMRFPIDVAFCDKQLTVVDAITMKPNRVGLPRPKARCVIEAEAGAFERWGLRPGDQLEVKE
ncbi:MAG TPA: DUF192 domain-containing protein [Acidimicrobiales bacterium]|nr:DUF192 domain-containing protein [Acidimicrobiales bacterium]